MNCQYHDQHQQCCHHDLTDPFQTILKSAATYNKSDNNRQDHPEAHLLWIGKQIREYRSGRIHIHTCLEFACYEFIKIRYHPAGYGCIVHHQHITSKDGKPAMDMPFALWFLKLLICKNRTLPAASSDCKLHSQNRKSHCHKEQQIEQYKDTTAIFSYYIWESPYISNSDRTSRTY